ncbi:MAG: S1 RNA-binding domain-containing protein, partial [Anaerolineales bacterium]|nr:S1 RNA-binding domain-containing protein [Anaerolineales bacterium]
MDQPHSQENQHTESFENLLENYDYQTPQPGQVLEAIIIHIQEDGILLDAGQKRDALVPAKDLNQVDESYLSNLKPGDQVFVCVISQAIGDQELLVSLSKGIEHQSWEKAEKYMQDGLTLELEIVGYNRGGLIVKFETLRGFLPFSLVPEIHGIRNPKRAEKAKNELVNTQMAMKVIEVIRQRNRLIFSAAAAQEEQRRERFEELQKGQIITGRVVSIVDFGAFVDLGGVDGLVHISQLDWKKIKHPSEVVKIGDEIEVKITNIDIERQRISLSRKALLPSPWEVIGETLHTGDYVEGRITRVVDFGAFVELSIGVEGLIHISQLGYSSTQDPKNAVKPNEIVLLRVLEIHPERKRVALSMRQVPLERQIAWAMEHLEEEGVTEAESETAKAEPGASSPSEIQSMEILEEEKATEAEVEIAKAEPGASSPPEIQS